MTDLREVFEMTTKQVEPDLDSWREQEERQRGARRKRRAGALLVGSVVGIVLVVAMIRVAGDRAGKPSTITPGGDRGGASGNTAGVIQPPASPDDLGPIPDTDYFLDLDTGTMTPLPESIADPGRYPSNGYAATLDGMKLAYTKQDENGTPQIFIANVDGTGIVQVTHDLEAADSPAWSPDGSKIAYIGWHDDRLRDLFVADLLTGTSTQLTFATHEPDPAAPGWSPWHAFSPSFTADGSSIVYGVSRSDASAVHDEHATRIIPVTGSESELFLADAYSVLLSPDGTHMSYGCGEADLSLCVAELDGSVERQLGDFRGDAVNGGTWSPDGTRIAYFEFHSNDVWIVDIATGQGAHVAEGYRPTWLNDHTLIVEMDRCYDHVTEAQVAQGCGG
jgi:WD40 repeat protein